MTKESLPGWKVRALSDVHLPEKQWTILQLGPSNLRELIILLGIKWKYQILGTE